MGHPADDDTAGALLDRLRAHPEWTERDRDAALDRLVERFPTAEVMGAVRDRLDDLSGPDAETLLRLVEARPEPVLLDALARAIEAQPDLPPDRAWDALAVLDAAGVLASRPALAERWDELNEVIDEDGSIGQLVDQIEGDPEGLWLALQGLGAVEPEVRAEIIAGLGEFPAGPGVVEFLRLLAYAHEPATRAAALDALAAAGADAEADARPAWHDLARNHPDPAVVAVAARRAGPGAPASPESTPRLERSLVSAIDGRGRASIVLGARRGRERVTVVFQCDIDAGVREVFGDVGADAADAEASFAGFVGPLGRDSVEGAHPLALGLLAGCLTLCGPATPPALRFWLEATAGPETRPHPFRAEFPDWNPDELPFDEMPRRARAVLDACPDWFDISPLTYELAEEVGLHEGDGPPDPKRDAGAYRFLFEHRLKGQLERYRRMLLWMAWFWRSAGEEDLARSALALSWQLSDAQHVVPGHPFTVALTTRSLAAAMESLARGVDPRRGRGGEVGPGR